MTEKPAIAGGPPVREDPIGYGRQDIGEAEKRAVANVLDADYITRGPRVDEFERRFAEFVEVDHAVATSSGTAALHLVGEALGLGPGDEVVTTPLTFAATAHLACYPGAVPVFADVDPVHRTLDPDAVERRISPDTKAVVPMHYGGHPADIEGLLDVADQHGLTVVWDACHALGGTWHDEPIGAQRDVSVFSFHPVKGITTGEGGMVVTDDEDIAARVRRLRSFDMNYEPTGHEEEPWYQVVEGLGYNYNVTDIQAALGLVQLDRIDEFRRRRDGIIDRYNEAFRDVPGIETPPEAPDANPMYHLYTVEVHEEFGCDRDEFVRAMHREKIGVQVHYVPLHYHPYFQEEFGYEPGTFPVTEQIYDRLASLPLYPAMDSTDADDVVSAITRLHEYLTE